MGRGSQVLLDFTVRPHDARTNTGDPRNSQDPQNMFSNLEFHRTGIGIPSDPKDADPGSAVYLENAAGSTRPLRFCSCAAGRRRTCRHLAELGKQLKIFRKKYRGRSFGEVFASTSWNRLAQLLFEGDPQPFNTVRVARLKHDGKTVLRFTSPAGNTLLDYLETSPASLRFLERLGKVGITEGLLERAELIEKLAIFLRSSEEQHLNRAGMKTNRQSFEESLWYRFSYHCYREFEDAVGLFDAAVSLHNGDFLLTYSTEGRGPVARITVPRSRAQGVLSFLNDDSSDYPALEIVPTPLGSLQQAASTKSAGTEPRARVQARLQARVRALIDHVGGEPLSPELARFVYGGLAYIPELEILAELEPRDSQHHQRPKSRAPRVVPGIELKTLEVDQEPTRVLMDPMRDLRILRQFDFLEIAAARESGHLNVHYAFGDDRIAIQDIAEARRRGLPYLETDNGWIDLSAPELRGLEDFIPAPEVATTGEGGGLRLTSAQILRLKSSTSKPVRVGGPRDRSAILKRLLDFRPSRPLRRLEGMRGKLRPYQKIGVEWLHFLYENELSGLLCDDMGLGKTHQAMALMVLLREKHQIEDPFLVICPRTVISHWRNKLGEYAPGLRATVYHGSQRDLGESLQEHDLLVASYGVLRNDVAKLSQVRWCLVFFDEIQQIKNQETLAHRAAIALPAQMKVGLTGTPIENSLNELKNLFDVVLPGYLGDDDEYFDRYGASSQQEPDDEALADLRRVISPFVLRRLKDAVLDELPEKIEDIRTCTLSREQRRLYREAINTRGLALAQKIRAREEPLPYIHIFALLNLLKQICDHPALAVGEPGIYEEHDSNKWDLFLELLEESLGSGQKVVVFSQYLGMIAMMEAYLTKRGLPYAKLTGSTRKRGAVVDRFNNDSSCRVFLGSLRAGGTGIDLVAGSVVIHYDRWWNAAKEDQATDRVYRIGQRRAVQVFKLVTEDTLEERIAAMIDRKRKLMSTVVQADHPQLGKIFTREELLELLAQID